MNVRLWYLHTGFTGCLHFINPSNKHLNQTFVITNFVDENGVDSVKEMIKENYDRIKADVKLIVANELERIANDEDLCHLLPKKDE